MRAIKTKIDEFMAEAPQSDDVTMLALRCTALSKRAKSLRSSPTLLAKQPCPFRELRTSLFATTWHLATLTEGDGACGRRAGDRGRVPVSVAGALRER